MAPWKWPWSDELEVIRRYVFATQRNTEVLMSQVDDLKANQAAFKAALNAGLDNIAQDIKNLTAKVGTTLTDADVAAIKAEGDAIVARVQGIADQTPDEPPPPASRRG